MKAHEVQFKLRLSNQLPIDADSFNIQSTIQQQGTPTKPLRTYHQPSTKPVPLVGGVRPAWMNKALSVPLSKEQLQGIKTSIFTMYRKG